jgi:hypothetical protein
VSEPIGCAIDLDALHRRIAAHEQRRRDAEQRLAGCPLERFLGRRRQGLGQRAVTCR